MTASNTLTWAACAALLVAIVWVSNGDADAADQQQSKYCEMVATWNANDHLPPEQRAGWPPFKGECK